jgi:hypothetical protein
MVSRAVSAVSDDKITPPLTPTMKRHLVELLDAPHWAPRGRGELSVARALERRGLVDWHSRAGFKPFSLNASGRAVAEQIVAGSAGSVTPERGEPDAAR